MTDASARDDVPAKTVAVIFSISDTMRCVASLRSGKLTSHERPSVRNGSESEAEGHEELLVNPGLRGMELARGGLDCSGLEYLIVRYGSFNELILSSRDGRATLCSEPGCDTIRDVQAVRQAVQRP